MLWQERGDDSDSPSTLLVGRYVPSNVPSTDENEKKRRKIAAFDFVSRPRFERYSTNGE
jgi:bifunctional polynucleotide phosphatase/kinase